MSMIRWQPASELVTLRRAMDKLFEDSFVSPARLFEYAPPGAPMDMYETENEVVVKIPMPGIKPEDVDITITGDTLSVKGKTKEENESKEKNYTRKECSYGSFSRTVTLPNGLQSDQAEAAFEDGILKLTIPKSEEVKPKQIKVTAREKAEGKK